MAGLHITLEFQYNTCGACKRSRNTAQAKWEAMNPNKVQKCMTKRPAVDPIMERCNNKHRKKQRVQTVASESVPVAPDQLLMCSDDVVMALELYTGPNDGVT